MPDSDFTFTYVPTAAEVEKFEYVAYDYFAVNPGYINDVYVSYVGIYYNEAGQRSGIYVANNQATQY